MKKIFCLALLFPVFSSMAQTEDHKSFMMHKDSTSIYSSYRNIGVSFQKFDGLNDRLSKSPQYEELRDMMGTLGLGTIHKKGHFVSMGGITLGYGRQGDGDKKSSALGLLGLSADLGYNFLNPRSRVEIYPTVGLGFEGYKAWLKKDISNIAFDDVLNNPTTQNNIRTVSFTNHFLTYRFGLNLAFTSPHKTFSFGLNGGYSGSFKEKDWKVNGGQVLGNAPTDKVSRFSVNLFMTKRINWGGKQSCMHMM